MTRSLITAIGTLALAVMFPMASPSQTSANQPTPEQPHMTAALKHLQEAEGELDKAESNKGGHRQKAVEYVRKAIQETNAGIAYAREQTEHQKKAATKH